MKSLVNTKEDISNALGDTISMVKQIYHWELVFK